MINRVLIVAFIALILADRPVSASDLRAEFEALKAQVEQGIGGYTGPVEPITEPIKLEYGSHIPSSVLIRKYLITLGSGDWAGLSDVAGVRFRAVVETVRNNSDKLTLKIGVEDLTIEHRNDMVEITDSDYLPSAKSLTFQFDSHGRRNPPDKSVGAPTSSVRDVEAVREFVQNAAEELAPPSVLLINTGTQGAVIFPSVVGQRTVYSSYGVAGGKQPTLRGQTKCGARTCLVIEIDENFTKHADADDIYSKNARAWIKGHYVMDTDNLRIYSGRLLFASGSYLDAAHIANRDISGELWGVEFIDISPAP